MKYLFYVNKNKFVHALAILSPKVRYCTAKRRWFAIRLGLYRTVLRYRNKCLFKSRRSILVITIAEIKRQDLDYLQAKCRINFILCSNKYRNFHREFIKEVIATYPEIIFDFLKNNIHYLNESADQGLYIALQYNFNKEAVLNENFFHNFIGNEQTDFINKRCLLNNIALHNNIAKLNNLNEIFTFQKISIVGLISDEKPFTVTNLKSITAVDKYKIYDDISDKYKVTVIVTSYNSSKTIVSCINSLLEQTWPNLEIIVIDDASTDDTLEMLKELKEQCSFFKVISLPYNVGTFVAKSIGAEYAEGMFLTCQDSDDWAHPQKIEEQVMPLIKDSSIIATTSQWLRLDDYGQYYVRQMYPFVRQNPASPMFRLNIVKRDIGLWHAVRTGADSEFYERLKLVYGKESIVTIDKTLTIASHCLSSLMNSEEFGTSNRASALTRLDYWESWRLWHISLLHHNLFPYMPTLSQQAKAEKSIFENVPNNIRIDRSDLNRILEHIESMSIN